MSSFYRGATIIPVYRPALGENVYARTLVYRPALGGRMSMPEHRAQALSEYTRPTTKKGLRAILGSIGFYRRYVSQLANQTAILTPLTTKQSASLPTRQPSSPLSPLSSQPACQPDSHPHPSHH